VVGPRTWFGDRYLKNVSFSGTVLGNNLTGTFGYAIESGLRLGEDGRGSENGEGGLSGV
jgi:hypothetical protein